MSESAESVAVEKSVDTHAQGPTSPVAPVAAAESTLDPFVDRLFSGAPDGPPDGAARSLTVQRMTSPVLQRAQRLYGNRASQRLVMRSRALQRQCSCGGTCPKCQEEEEQRALQRSSAAAAPAEFDGIPATQGQPLDAATRRPLEAHFGADLSEVRVHTSSDAADSATRLDSLAYTSGRNIYFAPGMYAPSSSSGQRLLAHEVAHVVQQTSGKEPAIAAKSARGVKIGAPDDALESEAEQQADEFMSGVSTDEELRRSTALQDTSSPVVQRKPDDNKKFRTNPDYVNDHADAIADAIWYRIHDIKLPQPHARLVWRSEGLAQAGLARAVRDYVTAAPDIVLKRMMMLSYPADLFELIDAARRGPVGSRLQAVTIVVATAFDEPLIASIRRMGTRAVVQFDLHPQQPVDSSSIVASSPLDGVVAKVLVDPQFIEYHPPKPGGPDDTGGRPFARGTRPIRFEWQGVHDPNLWNWIKVTSPPGATVEDVANWPFVGNTVEDGSEQAYRIAANPPYFGIPFETARLVDEATKYAPLDVWTKLQTGPGPRVADPNKLASSEVSDDASRAQAPPPSRGDPPAAAALDRVDLQIDFLFDQLAPWRANRPLGGVLRFVQRRREEFARDPKASHAWAPALAAQQRILFAVSSELPSFLQDIAKTGAKPDDAPHLIPVMRVIDAYAHAAAVSHLHAQAPTALNDARRMKAMLPLALAEEQIATAQQEVARQREFEVQQRSQAGSETPVLEPHADETPTNFVNALQSAADLRLKFAEGGTPNPDDVDLVSVQASEIALRARLITLAAQSRELMREADDVGLPEGRLPSGGWSPHMVADLILRKINGPIGQRRSDPNDRTGGGWQEQLDVTAKWGTGPYMGMTRKQAIDARRKNIQHVSQDLANFGHDAGLDTFFTWAQEMITDKRLSNLIWSIALQIGIGLVTGEVIGVVGVGIRGLTLAGEIGSDLREASLLYQGGEVLATAGANTLIQGAMGGKIGVAEFAENALGIVLTSAALKPFQGILKDSAEIEGEIQTWGRSAGRIGKAAAELVIDTGASIGAAGVAHAITHQGEMSQEGAEEWITMGLTIATSKFVHARSQSMEHRIVEVKRELGTHALDGLLQKTAALEQHSNFAKGRKPTPEEALELLTERRKLLVEERAFYNADPRARKALAATESELAETGASFVEVPLQLARLSPVVEGHIYEGSPTEIQRAFQAADAAGVPFELEWHEEKGVWQMKSGDRVIEIYPRGKTAVEQPVGTKAPELTKAAEARLLEAGKGEAIPSPQQIEAELLIVERSEAIKLPSGEEEVDLHNGHKWRRTAEGWCRYSRPVCVPARKPPAATKPGVRSRAQLDQAVKVLGRRVAMLEQHPESWKIADDLDAIRKELSAGHEAEASTHITEFERNLARAELTVSSGSLERLYGEPSDVLGARVIEYVPLVDAPPISLGANMPSPSDVTGQKLLSHVRRAVAEFDPSMFTEAERLALKDAEKTKRSALFDAYRGTHIDMMAKKYVMEDESLEHIYVTVQREMGADFYDSRTGHWYDMTTAKAWRPHERKYSPHEKGKAKIPGFRLPTEEDL